MTTINALSRIHGNRHLSNGPWSLWVESATGSLLSLKHSGDSHCDYISPRSHNSKLKFGDMWLKVGQWEGSAALLSDSLTSVRIGSSFIQRDYVLTAGSGPVINVKESLFIKASGLEWRIELVNQTDKPLDIEKLKVFLPLNQDFGGIPQQEMYEERVIAKFLPAGHGGYILVMRPSGLEPHLLFQPLGDTGFWDVQYENHPDYTSSNAYIGAASVCLVGGTQGTQSTPIVLSAGGSVELAWRGVWVDSAEQVTTLLMDAGNPALRFLPNSCVPQGQTLKVLVNSSVPVKVQCDTGLVSLESKGESRTLWQLLPMHSGEHLLTLTYGNDRLAYYRWFVSPAPARVIQGRAEFVHRNQFLDEDNDLRNGAIMQWDGEAKALITADPRPFVTGCCDECGLADAVFLAEKNTLWPKQKQIQRLESYVHKFLRVQLQDPETFAIKRWVAGQIWGELPERYMLPGWREIKSTDTDRTFNYVHVANIYFALYRIGKLYELLTQTAAVDYLYWAYKTIETMYMQRDLHGLTAMTVGHMGASNFLKIRDALREEGLVQEYEALQVFIDSTIDGFCQSDYPYGSEQSFDTSGYENIYFYTKERVDCDIKAAKANQQVARIMGAVKGDQPWWHWQGSDVRWWDFVVTGKWLSFDETTHHYMSGLNGWALVDHYLETGNLLSLRQGYSALLGILSNVDADGAAHMGYHWGPDYRGFDPYSGEIGLGLYGYLNGIAVICFADQVLGLTCYGGKVRADGDNWHITLLDGVNRRLVFPKERIAVEVEGAAIESAQLDRKQGRLMLAIKPVTSAAAHVCLQMKFPTEFHVLVNGNPVQPDVIVKSSLYQGELALDLAPNELCKLMIQGGDVTR